MWDRSQARVPCKPSAIQFVLGELEKLLEEAAADIDCPMLTGVLLAILLFADDIALFSYSASGLQKQLDILNSFRAKRGLTVAAKKTKIPVFEPWKSSTPSSNFRWGHH